MNKRTMLLLLIIATCSDSLLHSMERPLKRPTLSNSSNTSDDISNDAPPTHHQPQFLQFNQDQVNIAIAQSLQLVNKSLLDGKLFAAANSTTALAARDIENLVAQGADPNALFSEGNTALHMAALKGNFAVVQALVAAGARVNVLNHNRMSPLHCAVDTAPLKTKHLRSMITVFLIHFGANKWLAPEYSALKHGVVHGDSDFCMSFLNTLSADDSEMADLTERVSGELRKLKLELRLPDEHNQTMEQDATNRGYHDLALLLQIDTTEQFKTKLTSSGL